MTPGTATDAVAIFAPGGYDPDPERLRRAVAYFEGRGHRVVVGLDAGHSHARFSGTDDERLAWFERVAADATVGIAIALRGGYGATPLLPRIDFDALARAVRDGGRRYVGHSDFTAIGLGLLATTGAISFAGPMASSDFGGGDVDAFTERHFWRAMRDGCVDAEFATDATSALEVDGMLWGGNLAMLCSLVGTPWMPRVDGGILFIEDINEQPYRIERMLFQLLQAGVLERQRLVLVGAVSGYRVVPYDQGYDVADALARVRSAAGVPIVAGLPFGHCPRKLTLALGASAHVTVGDGRVRLRQSWDLRR